MKKYECIFFLAAWDSMIVVDKMALYNNVFFIRSFV